MVLVLLSPSKTQDFHSDVRLPSGVGPTGPRTLESARRVMGAVRALPRAELHRRLKLTAGLVEDVDRAIEAWSGRGGRPAAFAYTGETYRGVAIRSLADGALAAAGRQIRILSALYGVLRPLDRIEPYRLDFSVSLRVGQTRSLYEFWREQVTAHLADDVRETGALAVVNLASGEFARAVDATALGVPVITPEFRQRERGTLKGVTVFSKQARGAMARWIVTTGVQRPDELARFAEEGYSLLTDARQPGALIFAREAGCSGRSG
ncbi:MAG: YaaA family protein [Spirochaetaceae bacterium]|nr:MAG: YaaA family protein [Spirochaetaceae bacterium]